MPMNIASLLKAFDAAMALRDAIKRFKGEDPAPSPPPETAMAQSPAVAGLAGQIEARLTGVVVAALKEAFDRDHARLELERAQLEEQRRRAEEAMRVELRRQSVDRELARFRMLGGAALLGWIASVVLFAAQMDSFGSTARIALAAAWVLLLGAFGAAFAAQGRLGAATVDRDAPVDAGPAGVASLWLLIAGLAVTAISLLF
jgi:hypothetical protein